jgi:O-antigen/teichoic acid export membrane protein
MSRFKRFAHSLISGYLLLGANVICTLASVPLALHYLSKEQFGLWALVTQVCNLNQILLDLGMSSAVARILIDHKDDPHSTGYGAVIQTGFLVLLVQGMLMAVVGGLLSFWLPAWMEVPAEHWRDFRLLVTWQCVLLAVSFSTRIFPFILQAHQRYDIGNFSSLGGLVVGFVGLWVGFATEMKLYALLLGAAATVVFNAGFCFWQTSRLRLFPARGRWGRPNWGTFKELFAFGLDMLLVMIGLQLINASQALVITRTLGLEATAIWSVATKLFLLAQQLVYRLLDFSTAAFSEMMVRGERARLQSRFRDLVMLSGSASAAIGLTVALCSHAFLEIWTQGRISWPIKNDFLMACSLAVYASTRCHIALACMTKNIGAMKYIYFAEGVAFVGLGFILAPKLGLAGVILSGIATNLLFSGIYGIKRSTQYFGITSREILTDWLRPPTLVFLGMLVASGVTCYFTRSLAPMVQLPLGGVLVGSLAAMMVWWLGLPESLRQEGVGMWHKLRSRIMRTA